MNYNSETISHNSFLCTRTQGLDLPLDSDSISIQTCFVNLLLEFTRTTYLGNLYPIGLPESRSNRLPKLHPSTLPEPYPITSMLTQPYTFILGRITFLDPFPNRISTYPALHGLTRPNYLTRVFTQTLTRILIRDCALLLTLVATQNRTRSG
jgi:hypothetical protein